MDMHLRGLKPLICYCDKCAKKYGYLIEKKKKKGHCAFCRFTGYVTQVPRENIVEFKDFNETIWEGGGFKVIQQIPYPTQQLHDQIYPKLSRKMISGECLIFYDKDCLVVTNTKTGHQIYIEFSE